MYASMFNRKRTGERMRNAVKSKRNSLISMFFALMLVLSGVIMPFENNTINAYANGDILKTAEEGRNAAGTAIIKSHENAGYSFGDEWDIYSLIRGGLSLTDVEINDYYEDIVDIVGKWQNDHKPTDIERVMIALSALRKDVKNVGGVNLEEMLLSSEKLNEGSNELAFALMALHISGSEAEDETIRSLADGLIEFQNDDGGFALFADGLSGVDTTAMALQAFSLYKDTDIIPEAEDVINKGLSYIKIQLNSSTFDAGNSEATAQVILTLTSLGKNPLTEKGFSNGSVNTVTALMDYYIEGQGFAHTKNKMEVNKMATSQAFQALESFRRYKDGEPSFWELNVEDTKPAPKPEPVPTPEPKPDPVPEKEEPKQENNNETLKGENKDTVKTEESLKNKQNSTKKPSKKQEKKDDKKDKKEEPIKDEVCTVKLSNKNSDLNYTMTAVRKDAEKLEKLNLEILKGSSEKAVKENISKLAKDPFVFHFNTEKEFGAEILVEMETDLEDGKYLLMKYNEKEMKLELVQKVDVKDGNTKFVLEKGGDYCITEKASTESLLDEEKEGFPILPVSVITGFVAGIIVVTIVSLKKKAKDNEK